MAKTPIGEPIPVGDLSSLTENAQPSSAITENLPSVTEGGQPESVDAGTTPALAESIQPAPMAPEASPTRGWTNLIEISWRLALLPAVTWSSYMQAAWKAWEGAAQPQRPTR